MKIKQTDLAYIAAIIDAESCICISRRQYNNKENYRAALSTAMNDIHAIRFMKNLFGGKIGIGNGKRRDGHIRHNCYVISYHGRNMKKILELTLPYIKVKKDQAKLAIKFINIKQKAAQRRKIGQSMDKKTLTLCRNFYFKVKKLKTSNWMKR